MIPLLSAAMKVDRERESDEESDESEYGRNESMHLIRAVKNAWSAGKEE